MSRGLETAIAWQAWLPRGALDAAAVDRAVTAMIRAWSEKWCAKNGPRLLAPFAPRVAPRAVSASAAKTAPGDELRWQTLNGGMGMGMGVANRAVGVLAASILDADLRETSLTVQDRELIERLTTDCLDDLRHRLAHLFGGVEEAQWRTTGDFQATADAWHGTIGVKDREPLIRLAVPHERVIAFRKSSIPDQGGAVALRPLAEGLNKQQIALSAHLGRCALTLSDFSGLAAGDVLVMDKALAEPLPLAINGTVKSGSCVIEEQEERLLLKISDPLLAVETAGG